MAPLFTLKKTRTRQENKIVHIVMIDDNRDHVELMSLLLRRALPSCRIAVERNGKGAIRKLRTERPDLILLDVNLPGMDGVQVLRQIKSLKHLAQTPVIVCTTSAGCRELDAMFRLGADAHVIKTNMEKELKATVLNLL